MGLFAEKALRAQVTGKLKSAEKWGCLRREALPMQVTSKLKSAEK